MNTRVRQGAWWRSAVAARARTRRGADLYYLHMVSIKRVSENLYKEGDAVTFGRVDCSRARLNVGGMLRAAGARSSVRDQQGAMEVHGSRTHTHAHANDAKSNRM